MAEDQKITLSMMHTNCVRLMECLYIILEAGCNIKRLSTTYTNSSGARIVLVFGFNKNTWTIKSAAACATDVVNAIYDCLETLNLISKMEWNRHKINFLCHSDGVINNNNNNNNNNNKNIEIMQCVMNAMKCGWRVRKSSIRSEYTFNKRHKMKYKYLSGNFLPRFLDNITQREVFE